MAAGRTAGRRTVIKPEPVPDIVSTGIETPGDVTLCEVLISASIFLSMATTLFLPEGLLVGERLEARCCGFRWNCI